MLAALMLPAAACSREPSKPEIRTVIVRPDIAPFAKVACSRTKPPERALTSGEVLRFWSRDRLEIADCDTKRAAAVWAGSAQP